MITLHQVAKSYGTRPVLGPLDLVIGTGLTTVLIGPSGCGKSTLLRLILGLLTADKGSVTVLGQSLQEETVWDIRRRTGYVIQDGGLFPHLSAWANVTLMSRHLGQPVESIRGRVETLARLVKLPMDLLARFPVQLSGGQRQRVSLMRALMLDPELLLLDEPLGALDPLIRYELQTDLKRVFTTLGKTVLMVTHDMAEAAAFGDHIILMRDGRVVQEGPMDAFIRSPADAFVTRFLQAQHLATREGGA